MKLRIGFERHVCNITTAAISVPLSLPLFSTHFCTRSRIRLDRHEIGRRAW